MKSSSPYLFVFKIIMYFIENINFGDRYTLRLISLIFAAIIIILIGIFYSYIILKMRNQI